MSRADIHLSNISNIQYVNFYTGVPVWRCRVYGGRWEGGGEAAGEFQRHIHRTRKVPTPDPGCSVWVLPENNPWSITYRRRWYDCIYYSVYSQFAVYHCHAGIHNEDVKRRKRMSQLCSWDEQRKSLTFCLALSSSEKCTHILKSYGGFKEVNSSANQLLWKI